MDELAKEYVIEFYNKALKTYGDSPEAVKWTSKGQQLRFQSLLKIVENIHGTKILDYGCGKGDFYKFLKDENIIVDYSGFDINDNFIALAKRKYPECRFRVFDFDADETDEEFDYIFLCGVFNLKLEGLVEKVQNLLVKLFNRCRIALAFNALSSHDPRKDFQLQYYDPDLMLDFAVNKLSPYASIHHDCVPYDFTLLVRK